jgi:hypothetical protein
MGYGKGLNGGGGRDLKKAKEEKVFGKGDPRRDTENEKKDDTKRREERVVILFFCKFILLGESWCL